MTRPEAFGIALSPCSARPDEALRSRFAKLWYTATDPGTPAKVKAALFAALAYFVSPVEDIPDLVPMIGFSDDLGVVLGALHLASQWVTPEIERRAQSLVDDLLG